MARQKSGDSPKPLRERAEELLRAKPASMPTLPTREVQALVHELNVHQMELEIQNEELRQSQVELARVRDRYVDLYEFAPVGYATLDREGRIQSANLTTAELLAVDRNQLIGKRLEEHIAQEDRDACYVLLRQAAGTADRPRVELRVDHQDGASRWVLMQAAWRESEGTDADEWRVTFHDITQRKWADDALRKLNETLEQRVAERTGMLKLLSDIATTANNAENLQEAVEYTLRRVIEHTGWRFGQAFFPGDDKPDALSPAGLYFRREERRFERFRELTRGTSLRRGQALPGRVYDSGKPEWSDNLAADLAERQVHLDDDLNVASVIAFPVMIRRGVVGVLEFFSDEPAEPSESLLKVMSSVGTQLGRVVERSRSERRLSETILLEQRRIGQDLHDVVGQELAGMALSAEGLTRTLRQKNLPEEKTVRELAASMRAALLQVRAVVRGLLPVTEADALPSALKQFAAAVQARFGVECLVECESLPLLGDGVDAAHLFRIAAEAVNNAARHARAAPVVVQLRAVGSDFVLEVRDDGIGIPSQTKEIRGLGLSIMQCRADVIGASLNVRRGEKGGTVVTCTLPQGVCHAGDTQED